MKKKPTPVTIEEEDEEDEVNAAFLEAKSTPELFGEPLHKYSASRKVAANSMGLLWPLIGKARFDHLKTTGAVYPGILKDCAIVLWLCSLKDPSEQSVEEFREGGWTPDRARDKPEQALEAAMEWAEEQDLIDITSPRFLEAAKLFLGIVNTIEPSRFTIKGGDADGPKT